MKLACDLIARIRRRCDRCQRRLLDREHDGSNPLTQCLTSTRPSVAKWRLRRIPRCGSARSVHPLPERPQSREQRLRILTTEATPTRRQPVCGRLRRQGDCGRAKEIASWRCEVSRLGLALGEGFEEAAGLDVVLGREVGHASFELFQTGFGRLVDSQVAPGVDTAQISPGGKQGFKLGAIPGKLVGLQQDRPIDPPGNRIEFGRAEPVGPGRLRVADPGLRSRARSPFGRPVEAIGLRGRSTYGRSPGVLVGGGPGYRSPLARSGS